MLNICKRLLTDKFVVLTTYYTRYLTSILLKITTNNIIKDLFT